MRTRSLLLGVFAALSFSAHAVEYASGVVSVKVKPGQTSAARSAYKAIGATLTRSLPQIGWETIRLKGPMTVQTALTKLKTSKALSIVEPMPMRYPFEVPNDPMIPQQYSIPRMQLPQAWEVGKGDPTAIVAILDTGVDINHPDLAGACLPGIDTADGDNNPIGTNPHGTHCAGIAAAIGNNGTGIAGIAYGASILPVKVFPDNIDGASADALSAGIIWATDHGANVISMSLGGGGFPQIEQDAIDYAHAHEVVVCASAGNSNTSVQSFPGAYPVCICVGATDASDNRADFSNFGADWVDVAAPGVEVLSTLPNNTYGNASGTSMSCPNVAGVATLLISRAGVGTFTADEIRNIIESTCDPLAGDWVAFGRVNAFTAILNTGTQIIDDAPATNPGAVEGTTTGSASMLDSSDGISMVLRGVRKPAVGLTGAVAADFEMTKLTTDQLTGGSITFNVKSEKVATVQVYLWNELQSRWDFVGNQAGTGSFKSVSFPLTRSKVLQYTLSNGKVRILVRNLVPQRLAAKSTGIAYVDKASVTFKGVVFPSSTP